MYRCSECGYEYEAPESERFCYEDECGVTSMFGSFNYGYQLVCPNCGEPHDEDNAICEDEDEEEEI